jgi:hypothetical protein
LGAVTLGVISFLRIHLERLAGTQNRLFID